MLRTLRRASALSLAATGLAVLAGVGVASAHIDPDPPAIPAGQQATVGFGVEHGCGDANTTGLDIKLPDGVTDATAAEDGWQVAVADGVVRFSGGDLDAHTPMTFHVTFTAPSTPGTVTFPIVQHCGTTELDWLDQTVEGQPEPEHPAPVVELTAGAPTSSDLAVTPDTGNDETATTVPSAVSRRARRRRPRPPRRLRLPRRPAPAAATTQAPTATAAPVVTTATGGDDGGSSAGVVISIIALVVLAGVVAAVVVRSRRRAGLGGGRPGTGRPGTP